MRAAEAVEGFFRARASGKDSPNTTDGYRRDLVGVMKILADQLGTTVDELEVEQFGEAPGHDPAGPSALEIMQEAFGRFASTRANRSVLRAHSTWTMFFAYLVSRGVVTGSPMPGVVKPPRPGKEPKPLPSQTLARVVTTVRDGGVDWRDPWPERDAAVILTLAETGCRSSELIGANVVDVVREPGNEAMRLFGKGGKERTYPINPALIVVQGRYLDSARARFPDLARKRGVAKDASPFDWWPSDAPLFLDRRGERMRRDALKYLVRKVFGAAAVGADRSPGALVHVLRHTAVTTLAGSGVTAAELVELFGWASMQTAQHYIDVTGIELRGAAAKNHVLDLL